MGGRNFISRVYCIATSPMYRLLRERSGESVYMPRNFLNQKVGGQFLCCPPMLKSGEDACMGSDTVVVAGLSHRPM